MRHGAIATGASHQQATSNVMPRQPRATKSAAALLTEYADVAIVVAAWPDLPEAVRAGVLAIVNAAQGQHSQRNDLRNLGRGYNSRRLHYLRQLTPAESQ
jgi:predicted kinase